MLGERGQYFAPTVLGDVTEDAGIVDLRIKDALKGVAPPELMAHGVLDPQPLYTHTLPLEQASHAYDIFNKKEDNCVKVVLKP